MRRPTTALTLAAVLLSGCVATPQYGYTGYAAPGGYYAPPPVYAPAAVYAPAPVYVAPSVPWHGGGGYQGRPDWDHDHHPSYARPPEHGGYQPHEQWRPQEHGGPPQQTRAPDHSHEHQRDQGDPH